MVADDAGIPVQAMARFTAAEARLYPMIMVDPDGYQRATALVGLVVDDLRAGCADIESVLRRRTELIARLPEIAAAAMLNPGPVPGAAVPGAAVPADTVVDAASAIRCRELAGAGAAAAGRARIEAARAEGQEWVVEEPDPMAVTSGSYRRIERHLPSGSSLISSIEAGGTETGATYTIEVTGGEGDAATSSRKQVYPDRQAWLAAAAELRAELSAGS